MGAVSRLTCAAVREMLEVRLATSRVAWSTSSEGKEAQIRPATSSVTWSTSSEGKVAEPLPALHEGHPWKDHVHSPGAYSRVQESGMSRCTCRSPKRFMWKIIDFPQDCMSERTGEEHAKVPVPRIILKGASQSPLRNRQLSILCGRTRKRSFVGSRTSARSDIRKQLVTSLCRTHSRRARVERYKLGP